MVVWAVVVGLSVSALTDWSSGTKVLVAAVIAGPGAGVILWVRTKRLPESPVP
jgi:hypothetical protein